MMQLWPPGRCWILLVLTVIGGLLTTADVTELEDNNNMVDNANEGVLPLMPSEDENDDDDNDSVDDNDNVQDYERRKCSSLGVEALRRILASMSKYAAGHTTKETKAHALANAISAEYHSISPTPLDDEMRMCQSLDEEALTQILMSRSNDQSGNKMNQHRPVKGNNERPGNKNYQVAGGDKKQGEGVNMEKGSRRRGNKRRKGHNKKKITFVKSFYTLANAIKEEYARNTSNETGRGYKKKDETMLPKEIQKLMKGLSLEEIKKKLRTARNVYDIIRIFLNDDNVSDEAIRKMLKSEPQERDKDKKKQRGKKKKKEKREAHILANAFNAEYAVNTGDTGDKLTFLKDLEEVERHIEQQLSDPLSHCLIPQPKAIYMKQPTKPDSILPACTIVYKCRNDTGCCSPGEECAPTNQTQIQRSFIAVEQDKNGQTKRRIVTKTFTEHMDCGCRPLPQMCFHKCPSMFRMRQQGTDCICDCDLETNDKMECERMKDGNKALNDEDLACVTDGDCQKPTCSVGQFDVSQGKCPQKSEKV